MRDDDVEDQSLVSLSAGAEVELSLADLAQGTTHLSPAVCAGLAEAATVCLSECGHESGVPLQGDGASARVTWTPLDPRAGASNADATRATEDGAVALAILLATKAHGFDAVRRSRIGTGFDWHLVKASADQPMHGACLEVSGTRSSDAQDVERRLQRKRQQVERGGLGLPGLIVIIGFVVPLARVQVLS